jgi:RNA polymerase sigma factor (sigma-70 family)
MQGPHMPNHSLNRVLRYLQRLADCTWPSPVSDAALLGHFQSRRDEAAFEVLIARHGPMVLGLCQRLLRQEQDAEDAFQATFLTLARKAGSIRKSEEVASWLYKVAYRIACRARSRRPVLTNQSVAVAHLPAPKTEPAVLWEDLRAVLDQEITSLPERDRRVIVLCYIEGKTIAEAAGLLGCPKGTLAARLARARERLRKRLARRGCTLAVGALAGLLAEQTLAVSVSAQLVHATLQSVLKYIVGTSAGVALASTEAVVLTEGVLRMMWFSKMKLLVSVLAAVLLSGAGVALVARQTWARGVIDDSAASAMGPAIAQSAVVQPSAGDELRKELVRLRDENQNLRKQIVDLQQERLRATHRAVDAESPSFQSLRLRNADAASVAKVLQALFGDNRMVRISAVGGNALLIYANPEQHKIIQALTRDVLDREGTDAEPVIRPLFVGPLKYARACEVAAVLCQVYHEQAESKMPATAAQKNVASLSIGVDERTNSLVLACTPARAEEIEKLVNQLDHAAQIASPHRLRLVGLKNATATELVRLLRELYPNTDKGVSFGADRRTNQLILRCPPDVEKDLLSLIHVLDSKESAKQP